MTILLAFDNDGVLRDESKSYEKAIRNTVAFFSGKPASDEEIRKTRQISNNDYERTFEILKNRKVKGFEESMRESALNHLIIPKFQEFYLGNFIDGRYTGYIDKEPWLADNRLLEKLSKEYPMVIVSGAPTEEVLYTLRKNKAEKFFRIIFGMDDGKGKEEQLEKAIAYFHPEKTYFCDDRPSGLSARIKLALRRNDISAFGIRPPQENEDWDKVLLEEGAMKVFKNVNDYCKFVLKENN